MAVRTMMKAPSAPSRHPAADAGRGTIAKSRIAGVDGAAADQTGPALRRLHTLVGLQSARLSGLLHDDASQVLAFAHLAIMDIAREVPPPVQAQLDAVRQHLHAVADQLRRVSHDLHPAIVDDLGVVEAIKFASRAFTHATGIALTIDVDVQEPYSANQGALAYRLVQVALANIADHARATAASVTVSGDVSGFRCVIRDDGVGFDVTAAQARGTGLGLKLIRARIEAAGGTFDIASAPHRGACLRALIPADI